MTKRLVDDATGGADEVVPESPAHWHHQDEVSAPGLDAAHLPDRLGRHQSDTVHRALSGDHGVQPSERTGGEEAVDRWDRGVHHVTPGQHVLDTPGSEGVDDAAGVDREPYQ